jgi:hypothetical protein
VEGRWSLLVLILTVLVPLFLSIWGRRWVRVVGIVLVVWSVINIAILVHSLNHPVAFEM